MARTRLSPVSKQPKATTKSPVQHPTLSTPSLTLACNKHRGSVLYSIKYLFPIRCPRSINVRISRILPYPTVANMSSTAKSPVGPTPPLPGSVEQSYRQKCIDLKKRINEIESSNDVLVVRIQRARRGIQRMRLERAFLLQQLEQRTDPRVEDSEGSPSPPPTVWRASLCHTHLGAVYILTLR